MEMGYAKDYLLLLLGVMVFFFILEAMVYSGTLDIDLSVWIPGIMTLFGIVGGLIYARTGDWSFFFIGGAIILVSVVSYFDISLWNQELVVIVGWLIIAALAILRLMHKAMPEKKVPEKKEEKPPGAAAK